ncbi:MAG TPA: TaqI-like C-terminal specificity domain-containing protein [Candidatus Acidoferrales bacterium]|nr:TaqI-like C-terminal specificity domain-containing protein [Candidatus Acidoferrales bacterium]
MPPATKESFARALDALLRKYESDRDTYLSSQYNEAQTRTQFISPLLEALGWDIRNEAGVPYNLCEVLEEKGETHGRPDYTFRINGQTKFFLEAKSPSDELSNASIIQTKRYAWNSRDIFFAGVCDFEQFRFFDASLRPDDKRPLEGEAFHLIYSEYTSHIDKLWELSRDRVAAGSLDQFLRKDRKSLLQKIPVDKDFLENLTNWRQELASAIHAQNPQHGAHELNEIVQRLLDRIIFIRIAEDRKVIDQRQLWDLAVIWEESGGRRNIMEQLVQVFQDFNSRFNGEIFKPHACEEVKIESHVLPKIIHQLYPPKSNYRFDVIGVELLGSIYERYLGNTLRITPKRVFIEPKPEVRKAGGVYYTPQYIVDYIVKNTVGKLVEGKTPKEVDKIRILDPACGSGSFLIGAFQFLINWYLDYYREHPKEAKPGTIFSMTRTDEDGNLRLSFSAKSLILRQNLYGVDIDQQAVEVTMMSLYLKMLEGELGIQIPKQDKLPELKYNIRCGNSLIGPDIESGKDGKPLTPEERQRINPFDWNSRENGFGDILKSGGFDAAIGNPPYGADFGGPEKAYVRREFRSYKYKYDSYIYFIERGIKLLKRSGYLSYITPELWLRLESCALLRELIAKRTAFCTLRVYGEGVFAQAVVSTVVFVLQNAATAPTLRVQRADEFWELPSKCWKSDPLFTVDYRLRPDSTKLVTKIKARSNLLSIFGEAIQGITPYDRYRGQAPALIARRGFHFDHKNDRHCGRWLAGEDIGRYRLQWGGEWLRYGPWLGAAREPRFFEGPRLLFREIPGEGKRIQATIVENETFYHGHSITPFKPNHTLEIDLRFLLGIANSRLTSWFAGLTLSNFGKDVFPKLNPQDVKSLPIPRVNIKAQDGKKSHDKTVELVERMLQLNRKQRSGKLASAENERIEREIAETDAQIDNLVYELYGITDEERKIIEAQP